MIDSFSKIMLRAQPAASLVHAAPQDQTLSDLQDSRRRVGVEQLAGVPPQGQDSALASRHTETGTRDGLLVKVGAADLSY